MKVLVITYYWPPAGGSGVQRWLKFVKYLPEFGVTPVVFTVKDPEYPVSDMSLSADVAEELEVLRGKIWEPNRLFSRFGRKSKPSGAGFLDAKPSLSARFLRYVRANYFIPDSRKFWIKPSVQLLTDYLKKNHIDAVVTTGPPHSVHLIGMELKRKLGVKWIADFRDPWTSIDYFHSLPLTQSSLEKHKNLEKKVLQEADRIIVVGDQMKEEFDAKSDQVTVIPNGYDSYKEDNGVELDPEFSLTYAGLMNADRNPESLWKALGRLASKNPDFKKDIKIRIVGSCSQEVTASIDANGLAGNLEDLGYQDHQRVARYQRSAQVLLLALNDVPFSKGIVTGKIFEYLQARRPVLAIGPTDGDLAAILAKTRSGVIFDFKDDVGMENAVESFYLQYRARALQVNSRDIESYHRKNLTAQLFEMLKELQSFDRSVVD